MPHTVRSEPARTTTEEIARSRRAFVACENMRMMRRVEHSKLPMRTAQASAAAGKPLTAQSPSDGREHPLQFYPQILPLRDLPDGTLQSWAWNQKPVARSPPILILEGTLRSS